MGLCYLYKVNITKNTKMSSLEESAEYNEDEVIRDFEAEGELIIHNLLPSKSCARYELVYQTFIKWKNNNNAKIDEKTLLVYFEELSKNLKPSTLWSLWSMLRTTLNIRHNTEINKYPLLKMFLKNKSKGYKPKKSLVLTWTQIRNFLDRSDDHIYLAMKVILIFGIFGALRTQEFVSINLSDVEDTGTQFIVTIKDTKTYYPRNFVIGAEFYNVVLKYVVLRPDQMNTERFFISYQQGKCLRQVIGKNKISEVPKSIALYLNIDNAENFTGHCFRRTAATLLADSDGSLTMVKQLGGWKSGAIAESYIEHSLANRRKIFEKIASSDKSLLVNNNYLTTTSPSPVIKLPAIPSTSRENPVEMTTDTQNKNGFSPVDLNVPTVDKWDQKQSSPPVIRLDPCGSLKRNHSTENFKFDSTASSKKPKCTEGNLASSNHEIRSETFNEVLLKSPFVKFESCQISHLTINNNNYSGRNNKENE